ncbi:MAG TPA: TylF/MycF/NovP-related O-methyltransferase [Thermoanaerobaculia bacterium]|nr:TylF/MycF/NovP-related O-methyltransferase [Thermoanaerobaculia bacterium]
MSHIFDLEPEFLELYESCRHETMTSIERMYALYKATCYIVDRNIPGDFVECGVWRGGSIMLIASTLLQLGRTDRTLWLYDTFEGMTEPSGEDIQDMSGRSAQSILAERERTADDPFWGISSRSTVENNLRKTSYPFERFHLVPGEVETTIPSDSPASVSLLRLDTDWYRSTRHELEHLYPRLSSRGVLLIDDYGYWRGARKATDEYLASLGDPPLLNRIDYTGRICVKP